MNRIHNPFKASLGATPPALVGRAELLEDIEFALDNGPGSHERISVVTGPRGIGKTVFLNAVEDLAREKSWWVFSETATEGFVTRLRDEIYRSLEGLISQHKTRLTSLNLGGFGLEVGLEFQRQETHRPELTLRKVLTDFLTLQAELDRSLGQESVGVLISLDELHHLNRKEVIDFSATMQHLIREGQNIALVMAGIPSAIKPLLAAEGGANPITFLRRANRIELGKVEDTDVRLGLQKPVEDAGMSWDSQGLEKAVEACNGYPFQIQLVGQWSFQMALRQKSLLISQDNATEGVAKALRKLGQLVHEPALADLSDVDRTFLAAMAQDDGPTHINVIAQRLRVTPQYAGNYRRRLLEADMITVPKAAHVDFALPYLREYLREHAITEGIKA